MLFPRFSKAARLQAEFQFCDFCVFYPPILPEDFAIYFSVRINGI